jgi:solute carrier family 35, member F5
VESFSYRKLNGVLISLFGASLAPIVDLMGGDNDENRGRFPSKSQAETTIGNALAFSSAVMYCPYAVVMKKRISHEDRVNLPLFFGLAGILNILVARILNLALYWSRKI